jgi:hypothetical protein
MRLSMAAKEAKKRWGRNALLGNQAEKRVGYHYGGAFMVMGYGPTWEAAFKIADRDHPNEGRI